MLSSPKVAPEQTKLIIPEDKASPRVITEGDPDLTTYLNNLLRTKQPEHQKLPFWYPIFENLVETRITTNLDRIP